MKEMKDPPYVIEQNKYAFRQWLAADTAEDDGDNGSFIKEALAVAIREELTETQKTYILDYYFGQLTMPVIAEKHGVNKSSVSRAIARGMKRLEKALRYTNRGLLHASIKGDLKGERKYNTCRARAENL